MTDTILTELLAQPEFSRPSRLPSLFADFSPLALSNKDGYEANIGAWISALDRITLQGKVKESGCLCIEADKQLAAALTSRQWGRPLALAAVEREAVIRKKWIPLPTFLSQSESVYSIPGMFANLSLGSTLRWGLSKVYSPAPTKELSGTTYVSITNLEAVSSNVMDQFKAGPGLGYSDNVTTHSMLRDTINAKTPYHLSESDMAILIRFLERDKRIISTSPDVVKFLPSSSSSSPAPAISDTDTAIAQLKSTQHSLTAQIATLTDRLTIIEQQLASSLTKKQIALSLLRTRKQIESTISQRIASQSQISVIQSKLDDAILNAGVMSAMSSGARALNGVLTQIGGLEKVDEVLDSVRDQIQRSDEVSSALGEVGKESFGEIDESDVEDAYRALLESQMPKVPDSTAVSAQDAQAKRVEECGGSDTQGVASNRDARDVQVKEHETGTLQDQKTSSDSVVDREEDGVERIAIPN